MTDTIKQFGLFGEDQEVKSKSAKFERLVTTEAAFEAIYAAVAGDRDEHAEPVHTRGGQLTTIDDCELVDPRQAKTDLIFKARQKHRVETAIAAGHDPFADYYTVSAHEAYDAIYSAFQHGEDPAEIQFTVYLEHTPEKERTIKLSECNFSQAEGYTYAEMVQEISDEIERLSPQLAQAAPAEQAPAAPPAPPEPAGVVSAQAAHEVMLEALRQDADPLQVEVETQQGARAPVCSCEILNIAGQAMSAYDVLEMATLDHKDEMADEEAELAELVIDDWSM